MSEQKIQLLGSVKSRCLWVGGIGIISTKPYRISAHFSDNKLQITKQKFQQLFFLYHLSVEILISMNRRMI